MDFRFWLGQALASHEAWAGEYAPVRRHPSLEIPDGRDGT